MEKQNKTVKLEENLFSDFGFTEMAYIVYWIAKNHKAMVRDIAN